MGTKERTNIDFFTRPFSSGKVRRHGEKWAESGTFWRWYGATTLSLPSSWRGIEFSWLPHLECNSGSQIWRSVNCSWPWVVFIAVHFHRGINNAFLPRTGVPSGHSPAVASGQVRQGSSRFSLRSWVWLTKMVRYLY